MRGVGGGVGVLGMCVKTKVLFKPSTPFPPPCSDPHLVLPPGQMIEAPVSYQHTHMHLVDEWRNESVWPKHLLIQYK